MEVLSDAVAVALEVYYFVKVAAVKDRGGG